MSTKKSNKTSHVLNLLTNRIGSANEDSDSLTEDPMDSISPTDESTTNSTTINVTMEEPPIISMHNASVSVNSSADTSGIAKNPPVDVPTPMENNISQNPNDANPLDSDAPLDIMSDPLSDLISNTLAQQLENEFTPTVDNSQFEDVDPETIKPFNPEIVHSFLSPNNTYKEIHSVSPQVSSNTESEEYICVNILEELIKGQLPDLMAKMGVCSCNKCMNDVLALSLNSLDPKYVVTRKGYLLSKLKSYEMQYKADLLSAMTLACVKVKISPNHE